MKKYKLNWLNHVFNFLAVILGVYLAFYMNERSAENRDNEERIQLMQSLVSDLTEDIQTYEDYQIPFNVQQQKHVGQLLDMLVKDSLDGIGDALTLVFQVENYTPTTSTYGSMKSSGNLKLINDLSLQKSLSDYYEGTVGESVSKGEFQADYFTNELLTWLTKNVDLVDMSLLKADDLIVLRNKLIIYESLIGQKVRSYEMIVQESKKLKEDIDLILVSP